MSVPTHRRQAGAMRWWMPLLLLAIGTAGLVFLGWLGGVDMQAAGARIHSDLIDFFHRSTWQETNEGGTLRLEFDGHGRLQRASHDGAPLPLTDVLIESGYVTVTSIKYDDGELVYWHLPRSWDDELRESVRNPRNRLQARVHPRADGEPAGLRVARMNAGSPAEVAGLRVGDVIVGVAGVHPPTSAGLDERLQHALAELAPGGTLELEVERDGAPLPVSIPLEPMVTAQEWASSDVDDPVERYLAIQAPGRMRRRREAQRTQEPQPPKPPAPPAPPGR